MAKAKSKTSTKEIESNDDRLIRLCVQCAQTLGAISAGYKADPDGGNDVASALAAPLYRKKTAALNEIAATPAKTPEGVDAKARLIPLLVEFYGADAIDDTNGFFSSFARDVQTVMEPTITERWRVTNAAKREAA